MSEKNLNSVDEVEIQPLQDDSLEEVAGGGDAEAEICSLWDCSSSGTKLDQADA